LFFFYLFSFLTETLGAGAYYFELTAERPRCFFAQADEANSLIHISHRYFNKPATNLHKYNIKVLDEYYNYMAEYDPTTSRDFGFYAPEAAKYEICTYLLASDADSPALDLALDIRTGADAIDYEEMVENEHLSHIEVAVRRLNKKLADVSKASQVQKRSQLQFSKSIESSSSRVMWFCALEIVLLVFVSAATLWRYKSVFHKQKLF